VIPALEDLAHVIASFMFSGLWLLIDRLLLVRPKTIRLTFPQ